MRLKSTLRFDRDERRILEKIALSVPIAFGEPPAKDAGWRKYEGRHLLATAKPDYLTAEQLAGALAAAEKLEAVLTEQSERDHWDPLVGGSAFIAPGTDVAGVLAEIRARQLLEVRVAIPLLRSATKLVPIDDETEE